MKLRTLLTLGAVLAAAITALMASLVWRGAATAEQAGAEQQQAARAERQMASLLTLTRSYSRAPSAWLASEWRAGHRDLEEQLHARPALHDASRQAALLEASQRLRIRFDQLASESPEADNREPRLGALPTEAQALADGVFGWARERREAHQAAALDLQRAALLAVAVLAGLLIAQGLLVAARLLRPLARVRDLADAIARGDLRQRAEVRGGHDEIAALARHFDAMAVALAARDDAVQQEYGRREESERRVRTIADHIPGLVAYIDRDERYRFTNERFRASFGRDPESFIGKSMKEMLGDTLYARLKPRIDAALRGEPVKFERHTTELGGDEHHLVDYIPNVRADGSVEGFFALVLDITARKQAELAQAREEARMRAILLNAPDSFVATNAAGLVTEWNAQAERTFGWSREEAVGQPLTGLLKPQGTKVAAFQPFGTRLEMTAVHKSGRPVPVELSVASLPDGDGHTTINFLQDITARRAAEAALKDSQDSLALTGRLAGVGGWQLDLETSQMHWSEAVAEAHEVPLGYEPTLATALDFIDRSAQPTLIACLEEGVRTGQRWHAEVPLLTAKGNRRWVRIVGDTQHDQAGTPVRVVGALQDITERKHLELRLQTQESFLRSITDHLPIQIGYLDREGRYRFVNQAHCQRFGKPRDEILGRTKAELLGDEFDDRTAAHLRAALAGHAQRFESEKLIAGGVRCIESQFLPDFGEQGEVRGVFTTGIDVTQRRAAETALRELTDIFDNTPDFVVQTDAKGRVIYMNPAVKAVLGFDAAYDVTQHAFHEFYTPETSARLLEHATPYAREHGVWVGESQALVAGGRIVPVSHMVLAHRDAEGRLTRYSSVMRDISQDVQARDLAHRQTQTLSSVAEAIPAIVTAVGPDGGYRFVNSAFERWIGRPRADVLGRPIREVLGEQEYAASEPYIRRAMKGETVSFERDSASSGSLRNQLVTYTPLRLADGTVDGFVGVAHDITAHKQEELRLLKLSESDPLTGLLNRQGFETYLQQRHDAHEDGLALLYIDLDKFKPVNDTYGHPMGDELLKAFSDRLGKLVRPSDVVARLGGDEFAIVLPGIRAKTHADAVADKVVAAAGTPFRIGQLMLNIGASVGVAMAADDGWDGLVRRADAAVYRAKAAGRGQRA